MGHSTDRDRIRSLMPKPPEVVRSCPGSSASAAGHVSTLVPPGSDGQRRRAQETGDGLGYDVQSFELSGEELYIEVKATGLAAEIPFYFSSAELDFARRHLQTYALYRVSQVDDSPQFLVLRGPDITNLEMVPVTYQARLPRGSANGNEPQDDSR
jgi:Domain of unknown function (DUF3883)